MYTDVNELIAELQRGFNGQGRVTFIDVEEQYTIDGEVESITLNAVDAFEHHRKACSTADALDCIATGKVLSKFVIVEDLKNIRDHGY